MLGLVIAAAAAGCVYKKISESREKAKINDFYIDCQSAQISYQRAQINHVMSQRDYAYRLIANEKKFIALYDKINKYAKSRGYKGATDFFYYIAQLVGNKSSLSFARFMNKMRHTRNDIAHNGRTYEITANVIANLERAWEVCREYEELLCG